jgi:hypothetical protein
MTIICLIVLLLVPTQDQLWYLLYKVKLKNKPNLKLFSNNLKELKIKIPIPDSLEGNVL